MYYTLKSTQIISNQMLVLKRWENRSTQRDSSCRRVENQQTQSTSYARSGNQTQAALVEGEFSHQFASPAPLFAHLGF